MFYRDDNPYRAPMLDEPERSEGASARLSAEARLVIHEPSVQIMSRLWWSWTSIAIRHERLAAAGRSSIEEQRIAGTGFDMAQEFEPALIAVVGAALALDGLSGEYGPAVVEPTMRAAWRRNRTGRTAQVIEVLKRAGKLDGVTQTEIRWLFSMRGGAVHHQPRSQRTYPHPSTVLATQVGAEYAIYTSEAASRATSVLFRVLQAVAAKRADQAVVNALELFRLR